MSYLERRHPQRFLCKCGAPHLATVVDEHAEEGDGWSGARVHVELSDWYAPGKPTSRCWSCAADLVAVWNDVKPQPRDAVYVEGKRIV